MLQEGFSVSTANVADLKFKMIFDQMSDAILTLNGKGAIDEVNRSAEELTGFLKDQLKGKDLDLLGWNSAESVRLPGRARAWSKSLLSSAGTFEDVAFRKADGMVGLVDVQVTPSLLILRDVAEKKRMERELITKHSELRNAFLQLEKKNAELESAQQTLVQAGKMAALGELAAGIAHELNQPLQGIRGYAQELQALGGTNAEAGLFLKEIIQNVDKMAKIISYLRSFVRKSTEEHEMTSVHDQIEEALKMLERQFQARGISVVKEYSSNLPPVFANPLQLEQVFINLATNARDAIEATGRGSGQIKIQTRVHGKLVEIRFSDNGMGMDERTREKAFNPFFTTKEVGKGMGLGLSLSFGMISKLHGTMVVESEVGRGTTFMIQIPIDYRNT
jgi:PAS domain S-box-containing protein